MKNYDWGCIKPGADREYWATDNNGAILGIIRFETTIKSWVLVELFDCFTAAELRDIAAFMEAL